MSPEQHGVEHHLFLSARPLYGTAKLLVEGFYMFNSKLKKEALEDLRISEEKYMEKYKETINRSLKLHEERTKAVTGIKSVEDLVNRLANTPKEFDKIVADVAVLRKEFEVSVVELEKKAEQDSKIAGGVAGAGIVGGAGVAALGPSAAMAFATTFGTASTGTAISALSGGAASKAALAWLGGGALKAGGGGIVAGKALLALSGPVGWSIGGAALIGGGLLMNSKNKKIAAEAEAATVELKKELTAVSRICAKVTVLVKEVRELQAKIQPIPSCLNDATNFLDLSQEQKDDMKVLLNATMSLSAKLVEKVD
ncbi:hypothetical protein [Anoxynatronum sibiricum]|uniref:Uncharacterized protein n=1 Tax=Anoxynatronum sibiricum TaxID=210623 RepID=A0ABU9VWZ9_9CLOT